MLCVYKPKRYRLMFSEKRCRQNDDFVIIFKRYCFLLDNMDENTFRLRFPNKVDPMKRYAVKGEITKELFERKDERPPPDNRPYRMKPPFLFPQPDTD